MFRLPVYKQIKIDIEKAEGQYIWTASGERYTDFVSGISVNNMGHRHPKILEAIYSSCDKYLHISNLYTEKNQAAYAEELIKRTIPGKVFFSNSGAEANECAIKAARKYFDGGKKYEIITFKNSFHGRTLATLAATGQDKFHHGFGPLPPGFKNVEFNFLGAVMENISPITCAVMIELVQGEGGVNIADRQFVAGLKKLCEDSRILLIVDEIQTGMGRTGAFTASEKYGLKPDIIVLGKALGGGLPLGATVLSEEVAKSMGPGDHGSTFGGNPVSCAAGLAASRLIDSDVLASVEEKGQILTAMLTELAGRHGSLIKEIRGMGLMIGIELHKPGAELADYLFEKGFLVTCIQDKIIRLLPPFVITEEDIRGLVHHIKTYCEERGN